MNFPDACPDSGVWRAWLDRQTDGDQALLTDHLNRCRVCPTVVEDLRGNAAVALAALGSLTTGFVPSPEDIAAARERLRCRKPTVATRDLTLPPSAPSPKEETSVLRFNRFPHWRVAASGAAAALVLAFVVATPQGQAAAANFLSNFRSTQIQPLAVNSTDLQSLSRGFSQLQNLGTVEGQPDTAALAAGRRPSNVSATSVASIDEANKSLPFAVKVPKATTLPSGLAPTPKIQIVKAQDLKFTFDTAKADAYYKSKGQTVTLPAKFNGATLVVSSPAAVMLEYSSVNATGGQPSTNADPKTATGAMASGLLVGESGELAIRVEGGSGVSLDDLRQFLLSLPDFPQTLKAALSNTDWQNTLLLPVPVDKVQWSRTKVKGAAAGDGLLLNDNSGVGSAMIWHSGPAGQGQIYAVASPDKAPVIQNVADNLQ